MEDKLKIALVITLLLLGSGIGYSYFSDSSEDIETPSKSTIIVDTPSEADYTVLYEGNASVYVNGEPTTKTEQKYINGVEYTKVYVKENGSPGLITANNGEVVYESFTVGSQSLDRLSYRMKSNYGSYSNLENDYLILTEAENSSQSRLETLHNLTGIGNPENPLQVSTLKELDSVRGLQNGVVELTGNIDASETEQLNTGWKPLFTPNLNIKQSQQYDTVKAVTFDGNNYAIENIHVDSNEDYAYILSADEIKNLKFTNPTVKGKDYVGVVYSRNISNVHTLNGNIEGYSYVGGISGELYESTVENTSVRDTTVTGGSFVGGLIGSVRDTNLSTVSVTMSQVKSTSNNTQDTIEPVTDSTGGVIGRVNDSKLSKAFSNAEVSGHNNVGGLVGNSIKTNSDTTIITQSASTGMVRANYPGAANYNQNVGGLIGSNRNTVTDSYSTAAIISQSHAGGLIGYNSGTVSETYATGSVTGEGGIIGGLIATNSGTIEDSYTQSTINGNTILGGLVGDNSGTITRTYAAGELNSTPKITTSKTGQQVKMSNTTGGLIASIPENTTTLDNTEMTITSSYYDSQTYNLDKSAGGTKSVTDSLTGSTAPDELTEFDFDTVWKTTEEYPEFQNNNIQSGPLMIPEPREDTQERAVSLDLPLQILIPLVLILLLVAILIVYLYKRYTQKEQD